MRCKYQTSRVTSTFFAFIVLFTITLYISDFLQLKIYNEPSQKMYIEEIFDDKMKNQLNDIYNRHWMLFSDENNTEKELEKLEVHQRKQNDKRIYEKYDKLFGKRDDIKPTPSWLNKESEATKPNEITTGYTMMYDETTQVEHRDKLSLRSFGEITSSNSTKHKEYDKEKSGTTKEQDKVKILNIRKLSKNKLENVFKERKSKLQKFCGSQNKRWRWPESAPMIAAHEKNIVVCTTPNDGSATWHKLVHNLRFPGQHWEEGFKKWNLEFTAQLPVAVKKELMDSDKVVRIVTTRHPFARLASTWKEKFHKSYIAQNGNTMLETMPGLQEYIGKHSTNDEYLISFEDLAQYIADKGLKNIDSQLKSVTELCNICNFPYDYVIKSETVAGNSWFIAENINASLSDFTQRLTQINGQDNTEESRILSRLFRNVPRSTTRVLMKLYANDLSSFGYIFDASTLEAGDYD